MYTVPRPTRLHCNQCLSPAVFTLHRHSAQSSLLEHIPQPTHLHCIWYIGPPVSIVTHSSAHPSPLYILHRLSRLHFTQSLGPPVSNVTHSSAHPSPLYIVHRPSHINVTHYLAHPSTSLPLFTTDNISLYYLLCYIPPAHPFLSGTPTLGLPISNTTIISAHPSLLHLRSRPIRLHFTLFLGPSVSILHSIHY
jgi:hypothetical protein